MYNDNIHKINLLVVSEDECCRRAGVPEVCMGNCMSSMSLSNDISRSFCDKYDEIVKDCKKNTKGNITRNRSFVILCLLLQNKNTCRLHIHVLYYW